MTTPSDSSGSRHRNPPPSSDSGAFATYRTAIAAEPVTPIPRLGRIELLVAIVLSLSTIVLVFTPWVAYQNRQSEDDFLRGLETDGMLLIVTGAIAAIALGVAWVRAPGEGSFEVLLGMAANGFGFITAGVTWMNIGTVYIDDYKDPSKIHAGWGMMVATLVTALAAALCLRLWWSIRHYYG